MIQLVFSNIHIFLTELSVQLKSKLSKYTKHYPQLNCEYHIIIFEKEAAVMYYYKVSLSDLEISGHCSPKCC